MDHMKPLTQKAQGIVAVAVANGCHVLGLCGPGTPFMVIPGLKTDCDETIITFPMFARPCPFRPRHGFVNSTRVWSWREVIKILQEAKSADPANPVELVLAPVLTGKMSAVATNAGVTWGRGNDGVTAGKDRCAVLIPVKTSKAAWFETVTMMLDQPYNFEIPDFPYLEIVENHDDMHFVQVRDGPEQPEGVNHVVRKMKVQRVLKAHHNIDLLDWETLVLNVNNQKGVVIWAPKMSLASHFCVHGIESGIPVITDHRVRVGDVILPTKNRTSTLRKHDYVALAAQITKTLGCDTGLSVFETQSQALLTAVATTQAQFCWGRDRHLLQLRGLSVAILLKAVLASCAGEIRHWTTADGPNTGTPYLWEVLDSLRNHRHRRARIYQIVFKHGFTFTELEFACKAAVSDLGHSRWTRSFGGSRWKAVAASGVALTQATEQFCATPNATTWSKVVQAANRLINTSHNNGKCLTKWISTTAMDMISKAPTAGFLNLYAAQVVLQMTETGDAKWARSTSKIR